MGKIRCTVALVVLGILQLSLGRSVNYCGAKMCGHTNSHTFCQYSEGPNRECLGYTNVQLSAEEKTRILKRLNRRRNDAATGQLRGLPPAGNMLKLRWVGELAREAQRWADQCRPPQTPEENDACRDLYSMTVGQCVATVIGEAPGLRAESIVDVWYMQNMLYKNNVTAYIPPTSNTSYYGDFAQIIWASTYLVGCGRSRFMMPWQGRLRSIERLVCNFAPRGPLHGWPLWNQAPPATACFPRSLPDTEFPALCNFQYNLDETHDREYRMTMEEHSLLNTILEIEINDQLNYLGSIDELYLTKIAIATIDSSITTRYYYNPMHKRDILKPYAANEEYNLNVIPEESIEAVLNTTVLLSLLRTTTERVQTTKKKVNLIGRPKSYKMDDLSEDGGVQKTENNHDITDELPKEIDIEYDYLGTQERNSFRIINSTNFSEIPLTTLENYFTVDVTQTVSAVTTTGLRVMNSDIVFDMENENATLSLTSTVIDNTKLTTSNLDINKNNDSLPVLQKNEDDYIADLETVQELEKALDRMESSLETSTPAKVRRDLREPSTDVTPTDEEKDKETIKKVQQMGKNNLGLDRAPMLNMVLRYIPYLKPYENDILGKVVSRGIVWSPTSSFVLLMFYIVI